MIYAPKIQISLISNSRKQTALQHEAERGKGAVTKWRARSPHSLCCRAPAARVLPAQLSKAGVITPSSMGCSLTRTSLQTYLLGKQRARLLGTAGQCALTTPGAHPPAFPDCPQDLLSSHTRDGTISAAKNNWQL